MKMKKKMSDNDVKKETRYPVLHQVFIRRNVISRGVIQQGVIPRNVTKKVSFIG
jgi:hypothetical protein